MFVCACVSIVNNMVYNLATMFYVALKYDPNAERACVISGAGEGGGASGR